MTIAKANTPVKVQCTTLKNISLENTLQAFKITSSGKT